MGNFMSLVILLSISYLFAFVSTTHSFTEVNIESNGFTMDLIHRDSLNSPYYNSTSSHRDHIIKALHRSKIRANYFSLSSVNPSADMIATNWDYLMKINLGSPPVEINLNFDTGSVLTWTQCAPCHNCFPQNLPLFTPKLSSTYKKAAANSKTCKSVLGKYSRAGDNTCRYYVEYLDNSYTRGIVAYDTLTLNSTLGLPISLRNFVFGCGYDNVGVFQRHSCGIIGLGKGQGSFITQMGPTIGGKFSYCLLSHDHELNSEKSSKIHFGNKAVVSGSGSVSTRLYYYRNVYAVKLKGISVGKRKLAVSYNSLSNSSKILGLSNEKIIIDSGSTLTYLPKKIYNALATAMRKEIKLEVADPVDETLRLCYKTPDGKMKGPIVTFHFVGADVRLSPLNTFVKFSEDVRCLGFLPDDDVAIFGNLVQINFLVGYDIKKMTISFKPTDCSKQ